MVYALVLLGLQLNFVQEVSTDQGLLLPQLLELDLGECLYLVKLISVRRPHQIDSVLLVLDDFVSEFEILHHGLEVGLEAVKTLLGSLPFSSLSLQGLSKVIVFLF